MPAKLLLWNPSKPPAHARAAFRKALARAAARRAWTAAKAGGRKLGRKSSAAAKAFWRTNPGDFRMSLSSLLADAGRAKHKPLAKRSKARRGASTKETPVKYRRHKSRRRHRRNPSRKSEARTRRSLSHLAKPRAQFSGFVPMSAEQASGARMVVRARKPKKARVARVKKAKGRGKTRRIKLSRQKMGMLIISRGRAPGAMGSEAWGVTKRGKRVRRALSARRYAANRMTKKDMPKGTRAIGAAWKAAKRAQGLASSSLEKAQLRAMGLGAVPNRSLMGPLKDLGSLLPQVGVGAVALAGVAIAGQKISEKISASLPAALQAHAPAIGSGLLTIAGYMLARNVKALSKFSMAILMGGVAATTVHLLRSVKVKDAAGAEVSLAAKIGIPLGEYTSVGEYTRMGARPGHGDDDPNFVGGLDDEPDFSPGEDLDDADIGGIFDRPTL